MDENRLKTLSFRNNLDGLRATLKNVKTIFGDITEIKVTFCFDTSGSMYRAFGHFREHLVEKLFQMFFAGNYQKFNVVLFDSSIYKCYKKHVQCSYENIQTAINWMNRVHYESRSNLLGGLIKSFEDAPDAVYLVTDGFPNNDQKELLNHLPHISKGRPIRSIMITNRIPPDEGALVFLEKITDITNGSLSVISISNYGPVEVVMPIYCESTGGIRRSIMNTVLDKKADCVLAMNTEKTLNGDPMMEQPLVVPFIATDPISGHKCPFYHPFFHWYWPQYWHENGPGPYCVWARHDNQYQCMRSDFRDSRAFISGRTHLDTYQDPPHCSPYAGMMLINKTVLACNHMDGNNYYIGKVLSQVSPTHFLIKFDCSGNFNEVQKTALGEIIDIDDQKRHSIKVNDYVFAPLKSEKEAFYIAIVLKGHENRTFTKSLLPTKNVLLTVKFLWNDFEKEIEANQSIFLSGRLKQIVERSLNRVTKDTSQDSPRIEAHSPKLRHVINTNNSCLEYHHQNHLVKGPCHMSNHSNHCCCFVDNFHHHIEGRMASPVDDGKAMTPEQVRERIEENQRNVKEVLVDGKSEDDEEDDEEDNDDESTHDTNCHMESDDDEKQSCVDEFTETDLNWCILRILNKRSKQHRKENKRPQWKYWGRKSIPDVIDPPSSEPYDNPPFWGCLMPKSAVEWPSSSFQEVDPHKVTNMSPQKIYELFKHQKHQPSQRLKRDAAVGRDCLPPEETRKKLLERRFNYLQGGYPKLEIKNPYVDSVKPVLASWSAVGANRNERDLSNCRKLLEKSRIESQIQRDESNILRYVENKPVK